ncbi:OmpA family protein [Polyangium jinanense]|uniref:OmpA family protein n=1 Tax=Polyangium jinanense TaxID=2829994 RepID=A0A9X3X770_9BACT|nr:OmpA family protein [Polyangium jinanense]MDC3962286.1 OmpA family protein [Polyangium jinanense]MDC3985467.1 OmpA family protein [Polyangium jinanense]
MRSPRFLALPLVLTALGPGCGATNPSPEPPPVVLTDTPKAPPPAPSAAFAAEDPPAPDPEPKPEPPPAPSNPAENPATSPWLAGPTSPGSFALEGGRLVVKEPIEFDTGKDSLKPTSGPALDFVTAFLQAKPDLTLLRIEGHSDSLGSSAMNLELSSRRALSLARALVSRGVDCKRLIAVGFGEVKPIADNRTEEGRKQNRRMEFVVAAIKGRPVMNMPVDGGGRVAGDTCQ